jgi:replicative DNA helicase
MTMPQEKIIQMPRAVPQSESSERAAISCLLQNFDLLTVMSWPDDLFFLPAHRTILGAVRELHDAGVKTDFFAVQSLLEKKNLLEESGGMHGLIELANVMPSGDPLNAAWHREALFESTRYRKALATLRQAEESFLSQTGDISAVSTELAETASFGDRPRTKTKEIISRVIDEIERGELPEAFGTGLGRLDQITNGGVKRGELLTVAAPTSGGKSILLIQLALHALLAGKRVLYFSLEMPDTQVICRILSAMCDFNVSALRTGAKNKRDIAEFTNASTKLAGLPITVESKATDMEDIDAMARELAAKGEADLLVVDYIQLVHLRSLGKNETREQHVSEITKRLKALALQLNIAVATASQLNDEGKLRESRAIAHHSDHVWLIDHKDEPAIFINKNRDGERGGIVPVVMRGAVSKFNERHDSTTTQP